MLLVLLIVLVLLSIGTWPAWGYHPYGFYPSGIGLVLILVLVVLLLTGRL